MVCSFPIFLFAENQVIPLSSSCVVVRSGKRKRRILRMNILVTGKR